MKKTLALLCILLLPCIALADPFNQELCELVYNDLAENFYHLPTLPTAETEDNFIIYYGEDFAIVLNIQDENLHNVYLLYTVPMLKDLDNKMLSLSMCAFGSFVGESVKWMPDAFSTYILKGESLYYTDDLSLVAQFKRADTGGQVFFASIRGDP